LNISWKNPGRIDIEKFILTEKQNEEAANIRENTNNEKFASKCENEATTINQAMNDKFDPFEEFNNEIESHGNQIFDMRLMHNKSRENLNSKKVACMDKILDDIKKRYEYETELNQQTDLNNDESKLQPSDFTTTTETTEGKIEKEPDHDEINTTESNFKKELQIEETNPDGSGKIDEEIETFKQPVSRNSESIESSYFQPTNEIN
jgi:hypothetical protein